VRTSGAKSCGAGLPRQGVGVSEIPLLKSGVRSGAKISVRKYFFACCFLLEPKITSISSRLFDHFVPSATGKSGERLRRVDADQVGGPFLIRKISSREERGSARLGRPI
jgi:hypothetical protein